MLDSSVFINFTYYAQQISTSLDIALQYNTLNQTPMKIMVLY